MDTTTQLTKDGIEGLQKFLDDAHLYKTPGYDRNVDGDPGAETAEAVGKLYDILREKTFVVHTGPVSSSDAPVVDSPTGVSVETIPFFEGIIDINHNNPFDAVGAKARGVVGVVHKASEGAFFNDPLYQTRKAATLAAGLLWGAYHFAAFGSGFDQAQHFLSVEDGRDPSIFLALDFEPSSKGGPNMTLQQARDFVTYVHGHTGRWPVIYGGGGLLRDLLEGKHDAVLANCPLWLADYSHASLAANNGKTIAPTWSDWTLWQFKEDQDASGWDWNRFRGTADDLRREWPFTKA